MDGAERCADPFFGQAAQPATWRHLAGGLGSQRADNQQIEPSKLKTLVYLAAYLPQDGESMLSLANQDRDSKAGPALKVDKEKGIVAVNYAARADLFADGAPEGLRRAIPDLILDEPLAPLATALHLTPARYGRSTRSTFIPRSTRS